MKREANGKNYMHLSNLGVKIITEYDRILTRAGPIKDTLRYQAPEILNAKEKKPNFTKQNVWAIGVIAYELCTFNHPFKGERLSDLFNAIINDPPTQMEQNYSQELKDLISSMLIKDPEKRPSIQQMIKVKIIRDAVISFVKEFEGNEYLELRASLVEKDSSFEADLFLQP
jgi:NIMA (never in mitosis gene a)-related kinase